ncbi:MAG: Sir2 family NAD-dependent protein deacetylase [Myxococcota bacterium]
MNLESLIDESLRAEGRVLWLTGAGISAESGIPTFRGEEGYWRVGGENYHPQEMATFSAFLAMPDEVWAWYLYRRGVCRGAGPNVAHDALAKLEASLHDRFLLVTQNVDGLHLQAGNSLERTYQIHGNIDYMRPVGGDEIVPLPDGIDTVWPKERRLTSEETALLNVNGVSARPHVLWFDESYDEEKFRFESSLYAAATASLVVVVGTTGATSLPMRIGMLAAQRGVPMIVINPEPNPFSELVESTGKGAYLEGKAGTLVPEVCELIARAELRSRG